MCDSGRMTIRANRRRVHDQEGWVTHHVEMEYGNVERTFNLPLNCDYKCASATLENGLLCITIPKTEATPRAAPVKVAVN